MATKNQDLRLPNPTMTGELSVEQLLRLRRSSRLYRHIPLCPADISQLLWAAQGITNREGMRTAPSAGALYPLELYVAVGEVKDLDSGFYHYTPKGHGLTLIQEGDVRQALEVAVPEQTWLLAAPVVIVLAGVYQRTTRRYGERGRRYVHMEVGHAAENLFLQAGSLGLSTVVVGAFDDAALTAALQLPETVRPLILMPVGCE